MGPASLFVRVCVINIFCFLGKILDDEKTISEYKIEEKNFIVVMVTKVSTYLYMKVLKLIQMSCHCTTLQNLYLFIS